MTMPQNKRPPANLAARIIITGLGTGYLRPAPGTWASLAVAIICMAILISTTGNQLITSGTMALIAIAATIGCVALGKFTERAFGRKDPSQCTLDEWAGQAVALCLLPFGNTLQSWIIVVAAGLLAFRFFDILKPPPIRQLERLPAGWGVVADDLMAGLIANLLLQILLPLLPWT